MSGSLQKPPSIVFGSICSFVPTSDSCDDRAPGALDDGHVLCPLGRRDCELVERLRHVVHERVPFARRDAQVPVRALHVLAGVFLRTSGGPAQHLGNQVFESCRRYLVVRVVDQGIGVEPRIGHHAVDEVVYDGRDAVDTAEPLVKVRRILRGHWHRLLLPHSGKVDSMARFWSSLACSYGDTLRRTTSRAPSPLSTLTDRFADSDIAFGSWSCQNVCPRDARRKSRSNCRS